MACPTDPAQPVIDAAIDALADMFDATSSCPPAAGGVTHVRFFAGEIVPLSYWDAHSRGGSTCDEPFVWVRVKARFPSMEFPAPTIDTSPCKAATLQVIAVELGVGSCADMNDTVNWDTLDAEARASLDTSWRINKAVCRAAKLLTADPYGRQVGIEAALPTGPDGGVIAWTTTLYSTL